MISGSGMMILKPTDTLLNSGLTTTIEQRNTTDSVWLAPHRVKNSNISKNLFPILCQHFKNLQCKLDSATIHKLTYFIYYILLFLIYSIFMSHSPSANLLPEGSVPLESQPLF